jgi:hypothetical protein
MTTGNKLVQTVQNLQRRTRQQEEIALLQQLELPLWNDHQRGVPNGLLRSALFGAVARGQQAYMQRERIASLEGTEIIYTGLRLSQDHLSVWECLVHIAKAQQLGDKCVLSTYQLLKLLDKKDTGGNRQVLYKRLAELQATAIEVQQGRYTYTGSLVSEAYRDEDAGRIVISLHPRIVALYQSDQFTKVNWDIRQSLKRPLAKWLHGFYATHRSPLPMKVATLHRLCGSEAKSLKTFTNDSLIPALDDVEKACTKYGEHFEYKLAGDLVHVCRDRAKRLSSWPT